MTVTIVVRERGLPGYPELTLELQADYNEGFIAALKAMFRHGAARVWDEANKVWRLHPNVESQLIELCKSYYAHVYKTAGVVTTNLLTGQTYGQESLF